MKTILFVCVENSNRSQMAEAFARLHGGDLVRAASAGSRPSNKVSAMAVAAMAERGYDMSDHRPRSLEEVGGGPWDYVVTMGCGDACPYVPAIARIDWDLQDPSSMTIEEYRRVRDEIERKVLALLSRIRQDEAGRDQGIMQDSA
jgi:protein-tyrosine-phosphatase